MKICVIALPRSGSSTLCRHLADEHALKNIGEVHKTSSGSVPNLDRDNIVFKLIPQHIRAMVLKEFIDSELSNQPKYLSTLKKQRYASNEAMYDLTVKNNHILFPRAVDLAKDIISKSDTRIFLCRRDLTAQILSFAALLHSGVAGKSRNIDKIHLSDKSIFAAKEYSFKLIGIPLYRELYREFGSSSTVIYTEDLSDLTNKLPYKSIEYTYNTNLMEDIHYSILFGE